MQILSELAQMFSDKNFRESLLTGKDAAEVYQLISNWTPNAPDQHRTAI
ncbi:MAG: PTS sugar transporter subunit IIA [Pseudomonadota bacterium]